MTQRPSSLPAISVKICGLTEEAQLRHCLRAGVQACGVVLAPGGPRALEPEAAARIVAAARPHPIKSVMVFQNQNPEFIRDCLSLATPDYVQFHGDESPDFCAQFGARFIKAVPADSFACADDGQLDLGRMAQRYLEYKEAAAILLDHRNPGSGTSWRWQALPAELAARTVIAGGLDAAKVAEAVAKTGCAAVDASSGVETSPGAKSAELIAAFAAAARAAAGGRSSECRGFAF